jgi:hypothetical protein
MLGQRMALCGTLALIAGFLFSSPASSQAQPDQTAEPTKAERVEARANEILMSGDMAEWLEAADLLVESAHLRPDTDFLAARNLHFAATLYAWSGDNEKARRFFGEAAERAVSIGESAFAANAYLDAAFASAQLRMGTQTTVAARAALELAERREVCWRDRERIRARLALLDTPAGLSGSG